MCVICDMYCIMKVIVPRPRKTGVVAPACRCSVFVQNCKRSCSVIFLIKLLLLIIALQGVTGLNYF